jgi:hypothetical protein
MVILLASSTRESVDPLFLPYLLKLVLVFDAAIPPRCETAALSKLDATRNTIAVLHLTMERYFKLRFGLPYDQSNRIRDSATTRAVTSSRRAFPRLHDQAARAR